MGVAFNCDSCGTSVHLSSSKPEQIKFKKDNLCVVCQEKVWQLEAQEFLKKQIEKIKNFEEYSLPTDTTMTLNFTEYKKLVEMLVEKGKDN